MIQMKETCKNILAATGLRHIWNRWLGGNQRRIHGQRNRIQAGRALFTRTQIQIRGNDNQIRIGDECQLHDLKIIMSGSSLHLDIAPGCRLRGKIKLEDCGSSISIEAETTMENAYLGAYEGTRIRVGKGCMFSDQVGIRTGDMHSILDAKDKTRINPASSIEIEPEVWLCRGVTVLKGCTIGTGTVVGGYSIVTRSLPANVLAAGVPAAIIRTGIEWRRERLAAAAASQP